MRISAVIGAALVAALALVTLVGWLTGVSELVTLIPGYGPIRPPAARALLLLAAAVILLGHRTSTLILGSLVMLIGLVTFAGYALDSNLSAEALLSTLNVPLNSGMVTTPMAPATALCLLLLGTAVVVSRRRGSALMLALVGLSLCLSQVALLGYAYGVSSLYTLGGLTSMAPLTAVGLGILAVCLHLSRADHGLVGLLRDRGRAGAVLRPAVLFYLLGPFGLGLLSVAGQRLGWFDAPVGAGIVVLSLTILGCGVSWVAATHMRDVDRERDVIARERDATAQELEVVNQILTSTGAAARARFEAAFTSSPLGTAIVTHDGLIVEANRRLLDLLGHAEPIIGLPIESVFLPQEQAGPEPVRATAYATLLSGAGYQQLPDRRMRRADHAPIWVRLSVAAIDEGSSGAGLLYQLEDITSRREAEARVEHLALHDPLTNLPNRLLLLDRLTQELNHAQRGGYGVGVLFLDLDRFKIINDSHGHHAGDAVLCAIAERLVGNARTSDTVARLGGDEFVVVCPNVNADSDLFVISNKFRAAVTAPIPLGSSTVSVGVSIGVAHGLGAEDPEALLRVADEDMYRIKQTDGALPG